MKKIGLAVCYDTKNYGSQLQVLATIKKIEDMGFETEIIRYKKKLTPKFIAQSIPRMFNITFIKGKLNSYKKKREISKHREINKNVQIRNIRFDEFVTRHFKNLSKPYAGREILVQDTANNYDVFLCGSDQLWLPQNLGSHFFTLEFAPDNKPKISYATSFGVNNIPFYQKKRTRKYLNRFQSLSTRELAGQKIIKDLTGLEAKVVCDPTLLFNRSEWYEIIHDNNIIDEPYIFCYLLGTGTKHRESASELKKITGLKIVTCPFLDNFVETDINFGDIQLFDMDSEDFVNLIRYAKYILTDSFHGTVFSVINHKHFLTFDRFTGSKNSRNSRIDSLCSILGIQDRRYNGNVQQVCENIDYTDVDSKLDEYRTKSIKYLQNALSNL